MANLKWRVELEWTVHVRRTDNPNLKSLFDCIRAVKPELKDMAPESVQMDDHVLLTVDEMTEIEVLFKTGHNPILARD